MGREPGADGAHVLGVLRRQPGRAARAVARAQRLGRAAGDVLVAGQRPPVGDAPADQPERVPGAAARVLGQHEPRLRMRRGKDAVELGEQLRQP
jgi:hypothetical protein